MAATCPVHFDIGALREGVKSTYSRVALDPDGDFHFHRGADFAVEHLGYDRREVAAVPGAASARFAGVGNPLALGPFHPGETVLDHACGAGMDLLIAARRIGVRGRAIGVDMTAAMRESAQESARKAGLAERVEVREGFFEELPVRSASIDIVISNGVVNLSPDKRQVFREIMRVLKPGGRLYLADVVVQRELSLDAREDPDLWAACIGGALPEPELLDLAAAAGFVDGIIHSWVDSFAGTSAVSKVSRDLHVGAVNFSARKAD
jgi:arsenite methyltransferase